MNFPGRRTAFFLVGLWGLTAVGAAPGCGKSATKSSPGSAPAQTGALGQPVARIDDTIITVGEVQDRINKQAPFVRARYSSPEKKKEFVDNLIRIEVMAKEAEKRGYDKDPEVVRVMKQQMISKFVQKDFESRLRVEDVPDADVQKYYKEHPEEFNRAEEVRVSEILIKDKGKADKVAREAAALNRADPKAFRELVTKYSEDDDSKSRGGDLTSFERSTKLVPEPIVEAAFALKEVGDVSAPVKIDRGYAILKLTGKRPGFSRPLAEVKRTIQQRLFKDLRTKAMESFIEDLRKKYTITIDEGNLAKVAVETGMAHGAGAPALSGGAVTPPGPGVPAAGNLPPGHVGPGMMSPHPATPGAP
jgi:peptidyl-prolyl cis-trans isomerase C